MNLPLQSVAVIGRFRAGMTLERAGRCKLTEFVTNHVFRDIHRNVLLAVMNCNGMTDKFREYSGRTRPCLEDLLLAVCIHRANAENNFHMDAEKLYVSECFVCPGPTLKRIMPRAKGSADRILKRTSHVTLAVKEKD